MVTRSRWPALGVAAVVVAGPSILAAEDITVTTYYPSPRGMYDELRTAGDVSVGDLNALPIPPKLRVFQENAGAPALQVDTAAVPGVPTIFVAPATGNIGIRTDDPQVALHVFGEINANAFRAFESNGAYAFLERGDPPFDNDGRVQMGGFSRGTNSYIPTHLDGAPLLLQNRSAGNVGIRTPSPAVALAIRDDDTGFDLLSDDKLAVFTGGQIRTVVDGNGRLGIGTASPLRRLHVDGSALINNGSLAVPDGSIGVGTLTPSAKLHVVDGDIQVTNGSFVDDGTALMAPDFVFAADYRLMPLAEVQAFIAEEGHLPGVPAADDRAGWARLSLQERDMRLLEKIEELTVHLIRQEQRMAEVEAALAKQRREAGP